MEQNYRNSPDRYLENSGTTRIFAFPKSKSSVSETINHFTLLWSGFAKAPGVSLFERRAPKARFFIFPKSKR